MEKKKPTKPTKKNIKAVAIPRNKASTRIERDVSAFPKNLMPNRDAFQKAMAKKFGLSDSVIAQQMQSYDRLAQRWVHKTGGTIDQWYQESLPAIGKIKTAQSAMPLDIQPSQAQADAVEKIRAYIRNLEQNRRKT
ncbi:MAG: hypothetical protein WB588_04705 [Dehalococcoidia bacterium]